jgi:hypothetical protein
VSFLFLYKDSRPYRLHGFLIQSERGLSSATTEGHRQPSTYAQQKRKYEPLVINFVIITLVFLDEKKTLTS